MALDLFTISGAVLSECATYRYELWRQWDARLPLLLWVMLNPSTADAHHDDQTIGRCTDFARAWRHGGILVRNLFALRATNPAELRRHPDPVGPENDVHLTGPVPTELRGAELGLAIAAWGVHGSLNGRDQAVRRVLQAAGTPLYHLGLTRGGAPRHPSRLPKSVRPTPFPPLVA